MRGTIPLERSYYGFKDSLIFNEHYLLGAANSLPKIIVRTDGQWDNFLPTYEVQYGEYFDTDNCTGYGTENAIEILQKGKYGEPRNYSERFLGIAAGTKPPGNDPQTVCEAARKNGLIDDSLLSLDAAKTIEEYYSPDPLTGSLLAQGQNWLTRYNLGHEWVFTGDHTPEEQKNRMIESLRYSPLGVGVYAWEKEGDYYIRPGELGDSHWCVIFGYEEGKYWKCFDSYEGNVKNLAWDFGFYYVKRFHLEKKDPANQNWLSDMIKRILSIFSWKP